MDGLKNTSAIDLPLSWSPSLLRLNSAAWVSSASKIAAAPVLGVQEVLGDIIFPCVAAPGSTRWKGKAGSKGGAKRLQLQLSERAKRKTQPAGWVFRTNSKKLRLPSEDVGFRSTRTRGHARRLSGCAAVVLEVGELHGQPSLHAAGAGARAGVPESGIAGGALLGADPGVIDTRILSRLPGSSGSRERYLVPL
jgi:hypothetical protein